LQWIFQAHGDDAAVSPEQRDLLRLAGAALGVEPCLHVLGRRVVRISASATVRSEYSRVRRSSAARDSPSASTRPCFTSTLNQLSMPRLMNSSDDRYTMSSGATTSAPKMPTVRAVRREPGTCAR